MTARVLLTLLVLVLFAATLSAATLDDAPAITEKLIAEINNSPQGTWKAGVNTFFANMTIGQVKQFIASLGKVEIQNQKELVFSNNEETRAKLRKELPTEYDPDKLYPQCSIGIVNQGTCGSSWAFPVVFSAGNRYCITQAKKGKTVPYHYSTQYLLSCESDNFCCNGGYLDRAYDFIEEYGLVDEDCFSYKSGKGDCPKCPGTCDDGSPIKIYKMLKPNTTRVFKDVESAMLDIMTYGYIASGMDIYNDYLTYKSGVYFHRSGSSMGTHGTRINGWGVDSATGLPYWIVPNTYGTEFGMKGYSWVLRGKNECNLERYMTGATPIDH